MTREREYERVDIDINDPAAVQDLYRQCYPGGSGPSGMLRLVCTLLEKIADEKGFAPLKKPGE